MKYGIETAVESELVVRKSRFLGRVEPVEDRAAAQALVNALRARHPDASHVCWAMLAAGHSAAVDDGEPSGTAGRPMLEVLRHQALDGVLATVVRYFGGIKLGAGGLARAYKACIADALKLATRVPHMPMTVLACTVPYALEGLLRREIEAAEGTLRAVRHGVAVDFEFTLGQALAPDLVARLDDASQGSIVWRDNASDRAD